MKRQIQVGKTSKRLFIFIQDSSQTDGSGLTGLAFGTSGLKWYFAREDDGNAGANAVTLVTATKGTWVSGGFIEKDATNFAGVYEIGVPNAALASGSGTCVMKLFGAANMAPVTLEVQLVAYDPDAALATPTNITAGTITTVSTVTGGATASAVSSLQTTVNTINVNTASCGSPMQAYTQPTGFLSATFPTTVASPTNITAGTITTTTNLTNAPTVGDLTATMKASVVTAALSALSTAITETYAADGANASAIQLLYEAVQNLTEFIISGTTKTAKKRDGSTTAATYTLNDATNPTGITRAS